MKIKTNDLKDQALDWAVAMAENWAGADFEVKPCSTDWAQGGPIIEREMIEIVPHSASLWDAMMRNQHIPNDGPTPLVAAMRCYVASKLGDEIDVPDDLVHAVA